MLDRVPTKPGRVLISPEDGKAAFYATMARADDPTQEGNPLNKATLLSDATAAMFGFGQEAVPDNVLGFLGKYAQHMWWKKAVKNIQIRIADTLTELLVYDNSVVNKETTVTAYPEISVDLNGELALSGKTVTISVTYTYYNKILDYPGYYFERDGQIYAIDADTTAVRDKGGAGNRNTIGVKAVTTEDLTLDDSQRIVFSNDPNAYPLDREENGYAYTYAGRPLEQLTTETPMVVHVMYLGTGVYGASTPNSLTLPFKKTLALLVVPEEGGYHDDVMVVYLGQPGGERLVFTESGNVIEWYYSGTNGTNGPSYQANIAGTVYHCFAIGLASGREEN